MKKSLLIVAVFTASPAFAAASPGPGKVPKVPTPLLQEPAPDFEDSVVLVYSSKQPYDMASPWRKLDVRMQQHMGTIVDGGEILVTAFAVADAKFIEMRRFGQSQKYELAVDFVDYEANLALLKPRDPAGTKGLTPLHLGDELALNTNVDILVGPDGFQLSRLPARLSEVSVLRATTSAYPLVSYGLDVKQANLGWAEPVIHDGRLVGITNGQDDSELYAIPAPAIEHFLGDAASGTYRGFPSIGLAVSPLASPNMRKLLHADGIHGGVRIEQVFATSPFAGMLKQNDVLFEVAGQKIDEYGYYHHQPWGKVHFRYLLNQLYGGDKLELKVLRAGQPLTFTAKLARFDSNHTLIPFYRYGEAEPHLIFSGLVFQELTRPFLQLWGRDWQANAPLDFLYLWEQHDGVSTDGKQRVVILNRVLADDSNNGYENLDYLVLDTVNGIKVQSLQDVSEALAKHPIVRKGRRFARFVFDRGGGEVVLSYADLAKANRRIANKYGIMTPESFYQDGPTQTP